MATKNFKRTKFACYSAYFTMSSIFSLPPLLFAILREEYGISYTLLGTLVLTNFCTQLTVDLIFTFFTKYFNVKKVVRVMPLITSAGLFIYAMSPTIFGTENVYIGLLIGTILFSVSAGLSEVLLSPVIAAIPSDNPQKDMSLLHSLYAFGVFTVVVISTLFFNLSEKFFPALNWTHLTMFWAVLPVAAAVLFMLSPMPDMDVTSNNEGTKGTKRRTIAMAICVGAIFFGSCAENSMSNWVSTYMKNALGIDKALGDILGMAMFAILLGIARIAYAKYGKKIMRVLLGGMIGAVVCYLVAGLSPSPVFAFVACVLTGLFTAMLWPGTLIMMEENIAGVGVAAYALMASSGDLGASVAPQLLGIVVDTVKETAWAESYGIAHGITAEQVGLKAGMLTISIFPILGTILLIVAIRFFKKQKKA